jgi:hypothetical protein
LTAGSGTLHAGEGAPPLRFPIYECLYLINSHSQKLVDLLEELSRRFCVEHDSVAYYQSLIQCVRAGASQDIVSFMNDVELTEEWLFERLRVSEEKKFRDPEDAYLDVRRQEAERKEQGLPSRIQFLEGIDLCDLKFSADGAVVTVRKSKTDQEGAGRDVGLPFGSSPDTCPVRALRLWLDRSRIQEGPIFRVRNDARIAVKQICARIEVDPRTETAAIERAGEGNSGGRDCEAGKSLRVNL